MIKPLVQDNIVALATPPGIGAIAVIRVSGQDLKPLFKQITDRRTDPVPRYAYYETISDSKQNQIDNCLITYFPGPKSFTGEDIIEISSHGGEFIPKAILNMLYAEKVREAAPGEFSYRAFLNGKIDLVQAESISGLISAKTTKNAQVQLSNLNGKLSKSINKIKHKTITLLTILEHELDFTEDEINFTKITDINSQLDNILDELQTITDSSVFGNTINVGIRVMLYGKPNAGKSSLFNRLSGSNRAIVTNIPGTTRDTIETWLEISGVPVCIVDTAGINKSPNEVETIGIEKSMVEFNKADIILVLDEDNPSNFYKQQNLNISNKNIILIHTKSDLHSSSVVFNNTIEISTKTDAGIDSLYTELSTCLKQNLNYNYSEDPVVMSKRQLTLFHNGIDIIQDAKTLLSESADIILLSSILREFAEILEDVLGNISNDDIFNKLFSSFCVGK